MKRSIFFSLIIAVFFTPINLSLTGQELTTAKKNTGDIPNEFLKLYQEIDESLNQATQLFPLKKGKSCPLFAPELYFAGSGYGTISTNSQHWKNLCSTLDAFKKLKLNAVSVMITFPDLTMGDSLSIISFYQQLINEVHLRGMKIYIEYFDNPPFSPHAYKGLQDDASGRKKFLNMKEKELLLIYNKIQPDYLSIITEPGTMMRWTHLAFSVSELAEWVGEVTTHLKSSGESSTTQLGAGAGSWESEDYIIKFVQCKNLDYIDIHMYALNSTAKDNALKFDSLVQKIRKIRPGINITIGETWLYKRSETEPVTLAMYKETFFRDNFSFWSPLDQKFVKLIMGIAQKENISVVAPYFSQYFFAYYTFGGIEASKLPQWPICVPFSWNKAIDSIHNKQFSETGKALSALIENCSN
jgi:hypothetical protein